MPSFRKRSLGFEEQNKVSVHVCVVCDEATIIGEEAINDLGLLLPVQKVYKAQSPLHYDTPLQLYHHKNAKIMERRLGPTYRLDG